MSAIEDAERFLAQGKVAAAVPFLEAALAAMPAGWQPVVDPADRREEAFWDRADFMAFIAHTKPTKDVVWKLPSYSRFCYYLAFAAVERHDLDRAEKWIDRGISLEPEHPLLLSEKALILGYRKRCDEACALYRRAAVARPWNPGWCARAHRGLGFELIELGQLDEAQRAFEKSLELEPNHPVAKNELQVIEDLRRKGVVRGLHSGLTRGGGKDEAEKN